MSSSDVGRAVPDHAHPIIRVAQVGRQRRSMGHRAPGICVPPGPSAAHSAGSRARTSRVAGARARIGALVEPVGTPLVTHAREVGEAKTIGGGPADLWRPREALVW